MSAHRSTAPAARAASTRRWSRVAAAGLVVVGAGLIVASAVIHLHLWAEKDGYRQVPTVGPLFLAQGIGGCILGLLLVAFRRLPLVVAGIAYMAASIGGLAVSVRWGLFGYNETMNAPWAGQALAVEIAGLIVLLFAGRVLLAPSTPSASLGPARHRAGRGHAGR